MKKLVALAALVFAFVAGSALAAEQTWAQVTTVPNVRTYTGTCDSGTCDAPTTVARGVSLDRAAWLDIYVCIATGTITDGASVDLYFWEPEIAEWAKAQTCTVETGARCGYVICDSPAKGIPIGGRRIASRAAAVPNTLNGGAAVAFTVWMLVTVK